MRAIVAIVMGLFSGLLFSVMSGLVFTSTPDVALVSFLLGWLLTAWWIQRDTPSVSKVFARGFLIGSAQWLAMIPAGLIFSGKALAETTAKGSGSGAELAGATAGAGLVSFVTGGVSFAMAIVCLVCFAVAHLMGREMKTEAARPTRPCPLCAELIQPAAIKCRHCGASLLTS